MTRWSCRRYQPWLVDHADGVLDAARRQPLEQHLAGCPDCRADLEALRTLPALLQTSSVPDPGGAFWLQQRQSIGRAIGNLPSPRRGWSVGWLHEVLQLSPWRYPLAAALALLLAFAVYRVAEQPFASGGASTAARLATLDTDGLLAVGELAQVVTVTEDVLTYNPADDEVAAEALAVAELVGPHLPAHVPVPDEAELNDAELDRVGDLIGTIG
jgi:anti-sigma factor RsiW